MTPANDDADVPVLKEVHVRGSGIADSLPPGVGKWFVGIQEPLHVPV